MQSLSAGLLMFRLPPGGPEVLLVHPGGPFWRKKDLGAWSIPKGLYGPEEDPLAAARREFAEETGIDAIPKINVEASPKTSGKTIVETSADTSGGFISLGDIKQPSGKVIAAWAFEGDCSPGDIRSNTFSLEWPPKSGKMTDFPEVDRAEWFSPSRSRLVKR